MSERTFYMHYRTPKDGGCTLAVERRFDEAKGCQSFRYGIAYCSPLDTFSKKKGRLIADGRIRLLATTDEIPDSSGNEKSINICKKVLSRYANDRSFFDTVVKDKQKEPRIPRWFPQFVTRVNEMENDKGSPA